MTISGTDTHQIHQAEAHQGEDWVDGESFSHNCTGCLLIELQDTAATLRNRPIAPVSDDDASAQRIREYSRVAHLASRLAWLESCGITSRALDARYRA